MEEVDGKGEERGIKGVVKTNMCKVGGKVDDSLHDTPDECVKRALGGRHPLLQYYKFTNVSENQHCKTKGRQFDSIRFL